jgi:hypothetical protein
MLFTLIYNALTKSSRPRVLVALVMLLPFRRCATIRQQYRVAFVTLLTSGALLGIGTSQPSFVQAETIITPSVAVSERYDSNVYFSPQQFVQPGTRLDDYISSLIGSVQVEYKTRDVQASLKASGDINAYVYNSNLNYLGTNEVATVSLDGWVSRLFPGAKLTLSDYFLYTPAPPGFISGVKAPAAGDDPFSRGVVNFRANNYSNTFSANGSVPLYKDLFVKGGYSYSISQFGNLALSATGVSFFNTNVHTYSVGPGYRLTQVDNVSLEYKQSFVTQTQSNTTTPAPELSFNTQELWTNYTREARDWKATLRGGVVYLEPASKAYPTAWVTLNSDPERRTSVQLDLSRKVAPSYYVVSGASISNVAQVSIAHKLTRRLNLSGSANYAYSETTPDNSYKFTSYSTSVGISYDLTRTIIGSLSYSYQYFKNDFPGLSYTLPRQVVGFFLTAHWDWQLGLLELAPTE